MMIRRVLLVFVSLLLVPAGARAGSLRKLAGSLEKGISRSGARRAAVLGFFYPGGARSSGSSIVQERLTTFLVERGKVEVIERRLLDSVLRERRLELFGVVDAGTAGRIGHVLGAGALVTGTLHDLDAATTEVHARAIDAETGRILAAGTIEIDRTWKDDPVRPSEPGAVEGSERGVRRTDSDSAAGPPGVVPRTPAWLEKRFLKFFRSDWHEN